MRAAFCGLMILAIAPSPLHAQTDPESADANTEVDEQGLDQAARLIFEAASRSYEAGNFQDALPRYEQAYDLSGRAPLLYNIALCHDRLDHGEEAADFYERFVAEVPDSPRVPVARSRAEILRASRQHLDEVAPPPEPLPVESRSLAGPIVAYGVAGAGLVTFAVSGLLSSTRLSSAEETCMGDTGCDEDELDRVDRASLVADIGLGVAIAGAVVGTLWLLIGRRDAGEREDVSAVALLLSPDSLGAQLHGSF